MRALGIFLAVLLLAALFVVFFDSAAGVGAAPTVTEKYVVKSGDTLWSIASAQAGPEQDIRSSIQTLKQLNHLEDGGLFVGQTLLVPAQSA